MSHTPVGGHPQGWEQKLADRSLPPAPAEEKSKSQSRHVFVQPQMSKNAMVWREETEGSSASSARSPASPPYLRWARTLHDLLEDAEGVRLFRAFVGGAGGLHVDRLNFYFAVQGLRQETDPHKIRQVVSAIYKFLRKSQLAMPEELKALVKQSLKDGAAIERSVFDKMEAEVTCSITQSTYQAFLRSDAYVSYVGAATQPLSSPDTPPPPPPPPHAACQPPPPPLKELVCGGALATLHEGEELPAPPPAPPAAPPARLTADALRQSQGRRLLHEPAPGSFARKRSVYAPHLAYAGYCPASRQDSERGSLSSGRSGRTDSDAVSLSGSSLDGASLRGYREHRDRHRPRLQGVDKNVPINKEQDIALMIPRTMRAQSDAALRVLPPAEFAPLLIEKLERVKREQDNKERFERRLPEGEGEEQALPPQLVAAAIREKLQVDDDNDQDILDQHVSRVWSERTPGGSPPGGAGARRGAARRRRPPSSLSADSGLPDHGHAHPHASIPRRSFSKKTVTELTDSGVSVVSEGTSGGGGGGCGGGGGGGAEPRILQWIAEGSSQLERARRGGGGGCGGGEERAASLERGEERRGKQPNKTRASGSKSSGSGASAASEPPAGTVLVVSFLDESVPYRFKVPAAPLTLRTFKDYLPRKGNYRYFFKTECADLDNTVIQEEVSCDSDELPMYEGKVMARVKSVE